MQEDSKISIIVPIYKVEQYLKCCIESILCQTYHNLEIILVDDGSPDRCGDICDHYAEHDDRIVVLHKENGGLSDARNAGLSVATGEFIGFVDSDDWIIPDMYERMLQLMQENNADIVACGENLTDGKCVYSQEWTNDVEIYDQKGALTVLCESIKIQSHAWDKLYKRKIIIDEKFPKGKYYEDVFMMHKVFMRAEKVVYIDTPFYYYRQREGSIISSNTLISNYDLAEGYMLRREELSISPYTSKKALLYTDAWIFSSIIEIFRISAESKNGKLDNCKKEEYKKIIKTVSPQARKLKNRAFRIDGFIISYLYCVYYLYRDIVRQMKIIMRSKYLWHFFRRIRRFIHQSSRKNSKIPFDLLKNEHIGKVVLLGSPEYNNLGDHAIAYATMKFVETNSKLRYFEVSERQFEDHIKSLRHFVQPNDIILLQGGGNLGDIYLDQQRIRKKAIEAFPNNKIIIMPQTIYFSDTTNGHEEYEKTHALYKEHLNVHLFCREEISYHIAQQYFPETRACLVPDIVLSLKIDSHKERGGACCLCLREDLESKLELSEKEYIRFALKKNFGEILEVNTCVDYPVTMAQRKNELDRMFNIFSASELVVTDRLHGMIFAAITGTPCIVIGNFNHKIQGAYQWLKDCPYIVMCENVFRIDRDLEQIKSVKVTNIVDLSERFSSLAEEIKGE